MVYDSPNQHVRRRDMMAITHSDIERFWRKVRVSQEAECWEWQAGRLPTGYGTFSLNSKVAYAHRVSWELAHGEIPAGMHICHTCDNPSCVNPGHLFLGTASDNAQDRDNKRRRDFRPGQISKKLTDSQVREIRSLTHLTCRELAERYEVHPNSISAARRRVTFKHVA